MWIRAIHIKDGVDTTFYHDLECVESWYNFLRCMKLDYHFRSAITAACALVLYFRWCDNMIALPSCKSS